MKNKFILPSIVLLPASLAYSLTSAPVTETSTIREIK